MLRQEDKDRERWVWQGESLEVRWEPNEDAGYVFALRCECCLKAAFNTVLSAVLAAKRKTELQAQLRPALYGVCVPNTPGGMLSSAPRKFVFRLRMR